MTNWELFKGTDEEWDQYVFNYDANYRQLTSWANLKKLKNWKVLRLNFNGEEKTSIQIFHKKILFMNFFYCAGGPVGAIKNLDQSFIDFIKKITNSLIYYIRIDDSSSNLKNLEFLENSNLWTRPKFRINESRSAYFKLPESFDEETIFKDASNDFKSSLKRSKKKNLNYVYTKKPDSNHLAEISIGMFKKKKIKMMKYEDFENFKITLEKNMHYLIAYDKNKNPLAYRAVLVFKNKAWDIAAATSLIGRKYFAGFGIFEEIIKILIKFSVKKYDLGSLTSEKEGVNLFKRGTGSKEVFYVGEFEYCNLKFFNRLINLVIGFTLSKKFIFINFLKRLYF